MPIIRFTTDVNFYAWLLLSQQISFIFITSDLSCFSWNNLLECFELYSKERERSKARVCAYVCVLTKNTARFLYRQKKSSCSWTVLLFLIYFVVVEWVVWWRAVLLDIILCTHGSSTNSYNNNNNILSCSFYSFKIRRSKISIIKGVS